MIKKSLKLNDFSINNSSPPYILLSHVVFFVFSLNRYGAKDGQSVMVECMSCASNIPEWYVHLYISYVHQ